MDRTEDGRALKILVLIDEYTRRCLTIVVARSIASHDVVVTFAHLADEHGAPAHMGSGACSGAWQR